MIRALVAFVVGVALSLAFEPVAIPVVAPFCVAGYVLCLHGLAGGRRARRRGFGVGLAFGVGFYFTHIWWMRAVATAAWIGLASLEALFYGLLGAVVVVLVRRRWWPLTVTAAWVTMEVWRSSWPFSGMPWGRLAFSVVDTPLTGLLPWIGMVGVSGVVALLGALLAHLVLHRRALVLVPLLIVGGVIALSVAVPYDPGPEDGEATVAAVQGNVPGPGNDVLYDYEQVTRNHAEATEQLAAQVAAGTEPRPDFVVWPENSTAVDPFADAETHSAIEAAVSAIDVPVLVGAIVDDGADYVLNQGIVWDPVSGAGDRYTKRHPVPYGEYIPARRFADFNFGELARISRDMRAGTRTEPLDVAGVPVADAICFDVAYDDGIDAQVRHGAQMLTVQTSNATFIFTDQIEQQFAITRLRAIETQKWLVVASTNGLSGIIDPEGHVVATADPRTTAVMVHRVGLRTGATPGVVLTPWIGWVALVVTLVGLCAGFVPYRRLRPTPEEKT
ncbi:apolipoprotein N-acyltransferase [Nocardioides acrostichi]|uniref:Apolipoprotein N-acyltransferase n=1 Tax=Nocardioides acrostichi TaxID=2784339 RepID=A0A930UZP7_9ACTN|nr:apolipoprotein N-acyltransferase [Nocardioides acrostichi]MBF4162010.1 apolipoprotein N-acyltransferase [Nocardioides acrostichi]